MEVEILTSDFATPWAPRTFTDPTKQWMKLRNLPHGPGEGPFPEGLCGTGLEVGAGNMFNLALIK